MKVTVNICWNIFGTGFPLLVGVVSIPPLINALGTARFSILSLAWIVVGYFSFFDLGLGRAMTQLVANKIGLEQEAEIPAIVRSGIVLMALLGISGGLLAAAVAPWLVNVKLVLPDSLRSETLTSFFLLAGSIPIVIVTTGLRGILEARQRFDMVNIVRAPLSSLTYLAPLIVLQYSNALPDIISALVVSRFLSCVVYLVICWRLYPELMRGTSYCPRLLRQMLIFGGWMTLSNIAAPLLLYLGRLALGIMVAVDAIAYFSVPYDMIINALIIPSAFVGVLFPKFAQQFPQSRLQVKLLYKQWMLYNFLVMFAICCIICLLVKPTLAWWISATFSNHSYRVAQWLAMGIFINSFGHLSQALIQAYGRPDLTAKLHVLELIAYVPYMWWLIKYHGIEGAAISWVVRVSISTIALAVLAQLCLSGTIKRAH